MTPHETARVRTHLMPAPEHPTPALSDAVLALLERLHASDLQSCRRWASRAEAMPDAGYEGFVVDGQHNARTVRHALRDHGHDNLADRLAAEACEIAAVAQCGGVPKTPNEGA